MPDNRLLLVFRYVFIFSFNPFKFCIFAVKLVYILLPSFFQKFLLLFLLLVFFFSSLIFNQFQ